jgi:hypothetical protein
MKDAYYFSHDSNASQDEKILNLRADHGWEGYGIYWAIIERLRDSSDHKYKNDSIKGLSVSLGIKRPVLEEIVNNYDLFDSDEDCFWSPSLMRRMDIVEKKRGLAKKASKARWVKNVSDSNAAQQISENDANTDADAMQMQCGRNADASIVQCEIDADAMQGKEMKRNERKENERKENFLDTHTIAREFKIEILEVFEKRGLDFEAADSEFEKFIAFFDERVNVAKTWTIKHDYQQKNSNNGKTGKTQNIYGTGRAPRNSAAVIAEADGIIERAFGKR